MARHGEAGEVEGALVDRLQERRLGVDHAATSHDPFDLRDDEVRAVHMLEHRLDHDGVDRPGVQGDPVSVGDERRLVGRVDVEGNGADGLVRHESLQPIAHGRTTDDQDERSLICRVQPPEQIGNGIRSGSRWCERGLRAAGGAAPETLRLRAIGIIDVDRRELPPPELQPVGRKQVRARARDRKPTSGWRLERLAVVGE